MDDDVEAFLSEDLEAPAALAHWEDFVIDTTMRAVAPVTTARVLAA